MDDLELQTVGIEEEDRVVARRVPVLLWLAFELGVVAAEPFRPLVDHGARLRAEGEVVQPDRVAVVAGADLGRLSGANPDRRAGAAQVPDRLAALARALADAVPAERPEQIAVERQAPLHRPDDEDHVVHTGRSQQASLPAGKRESCLGGRWPELRPAAVAH